MRQLTAFTKKEFLESLRTGRMPLLVILSVLFGIMNPLTAKLLPWMLKTFTGSLEESGMVLTEIKVDVFTSWTQFYKNIPLFLIIFIVITSGILTTEYQKGTLINILTKGMHRWKLLLSNSIAAFLLWTGCYWISFGVTYAYNMYFWDNSMASHIFFGAFCLYMTGIWLITLIMLMSALCSTNYMVLAGTGGTFFVFYLLAFIPALKKYLPAQLMASYSLLPKTADISDFTYAVIVTAILSVVNLLLSILIFNKKSL